MIHCRSFREWLVIRAAELAEPDCDLCGGNGEWDTVEFCPGENPHTNCICAGTQFIVCVCVLDAIDQDANSTCHTMEMLKREYDQQCATDRLRYHEYLQPHSQLSAS